jgi:glycerophosphoryl diester phosphodiesterase
MPSSPSRRTELARLIARPFAHRGLHGQAGPENSRAAFAAAIAAGDGIELDVQRCLMGEAIVFHDDELDRLTEEKGPVGAFELEELIEIRLKGSNETIPWLNDVLDLIAGRAPLLIEVKSPKHDLRALCRSVAWGLARYDGPVAVMSFNPQVPRWFSRHAPDVLRGLVVTEQGKRWRGPWERPFALWWAKPDFLAYDLRDLPSRFAEAQRARGMPVLTWTVRTHADRARATEHASQIIFEMPRP